MLNTNHNTIINKHGEHVIKRLWQKLGYRQAAARLGITVSVLRTIVKHKNWKRPVKYLPSVLKAVRQGKASEDDFPHVNFEDTGHTDLGDTHPSILCTEDLEITLIPTEHDKSLQTEKSFFLKITVNHSNHTNTYNETT